MKKLLAIGAGLALLAGGNAYACDQPEPIERQRAAELEAAIGKEGASIARLGAFEELSCASKPEYRRAALEAAFKSNDKMLRGAALATALMAREGIRVDLLEDAKTDPAAKSFIKENGGSIAYQFKNKDRARNCINFSSGQEACYGDTVFVIDGLTVRLTDRSRSPSLTGEFTLQPDNTLKGKLRRERTQPIDATIQIL
jgi:hypothetical protein|tara:strand:- start:1046 stop:1642 length:597 start_codon:yes stop_codon:yes gene_type:complete